MNKRFIDTSWRAMFEVRIRVNAYAPGIDGWEIVNIHNGTVVGTYRESRYATKQARRKYKKFIRLMEKSLMSIEFG